MYTVRKGMVAKARKSSNRINSPCLYHSSSGNHRLAWMTGRLLRFLQSRLQDLTQRTLQRAAEKEAVHTGMADERKVSNKIITPSSFSFRYIVSYPIYFFDSGTTDSLLPPCRISIHFIWCGVTISTIPSGTNHDNSLFCCSLDSRVNGRMGVRDT